MDQSETVMKPIKATRSASGGQQQQSSSSSADSGGGGGGGGNGGLKFGPAWLRQLSCGESSNKTALPPSPGLAFQLAKNRYAREEMIAIYEVIEKQLKSAPAPARLYKDFGELCKRELQRPVCLTQPSPEEQVLIIDNFQQSFISYTNLNVFYVTLAVLMNLYLFYTLFLGVFEH